LRCVAAALGRTAAGHGNGSFRRCRHCRPCRRDVGPGCWSVRGCRRTPRGTTGTDRVVERSMALVWGVLDAFLAVVVLVVTLA
jgi:hypothetical protein